MNKRIALVVNSLSGGGAEMTASNLSRVLSEWYDVDIIVNDDVNVMYPYHGKIISLRMPADKNRIGGAYQITALIRRTRLLKTLKKNRQYTAVRSFSEMTNLANVLSGGKSIVSVHSSTKNSLKNSWKNKLVVKYVYPFIFKKADITVACSEEICDELITKHGLPKEKGFTIYNGIDLEKINQETLIPLPDEMFGSEEKVIVSVGRLIWQKGQWHLIRAIRKLVTEGIPLKLVILGEGYMRPQLEELIKEAGLEGVVSLPGFVNNPYQFMAGADIVVFPSQTEGFSNAIVEALACGVPVVSTDHETGAREILAPETDYHVKTKAKIEEATYGILVPVCDNYFHHANEPLTFEEELMVEAIRKLLLDKEMCLSYGRLALTRAEQLRIDLISQDWIRLIDG